MELWQRIRTELLRLLIGKSSVVANVKITGDVEYREGNVFIFQDEDTDDDDWVDELIRTLA